MHCVLDRFLSLLSIPRHGILHCFSLSEVFFIPIDRYCYLCHALLCPFKPSDPHLSDHPQKRQDEQNQQH